MPHPSRVSSTAAVVCTICNKTVSRKADLPRHMRTHDVNKRALMHACPYEGCDYKTLQKSNVQTHIRTHTGERTKKCPEESCSYTTADPGSLTRHRKTIHGYEPKATKPQRRARAHPYARNTSVPNEEVIDLTYESSASSSSSGSPSSGTSRSSPWSYSGSSSPEPSLGSWSYDDCLPILMSETYLPMPEVFPQMPTAEIEACPPVFDEKMLLPPIEQELPSSPTAEFLKLFSPLLLRSPSPKQLLPAVGAGAVDGAYRSSPAEVDMPVLHVDGSATMPSCISPSPMYAASPSYMVPSYCTAPQHGYEQPIADAALDYSPLANKGFWSLESDVPPMSPLRLSSVPPAGFEAFPAMDLDGVFDWEAMGMGSMSDCARPSPSYEGPTYSYDCATSYEAPQISCDALPSYTVPPFYIPPSAPLAIDATELNLFIEGCC